MKTGFIKTSLFLLSTTVIIFILLSFNGYDKGVYEEYSYHSKNELFAFADIQELPTETNTLFSGSGNCVLCHGDPGQFPSSDANTDISGNDVSPVSLWRATMMANAAKDPFWRAKVKHEVLQNPTLEDAIETLCVTCHAPNGHFDAMHNGLTTYTIDDLILDPMGLDGVSCTSCHTMADEGLGITFSGDITYETNQSAYGQYTSPFTNSMFNVTNFTPYYGEHISSSEACGKCHSLITETINEAGEITENSFVEQAIYHEWLNSTYAIDETTCIDCHMPTLDEGVILSPMPPFLTERTSFAKHDLVGGNVFMLNLLKNNSSDLDINASDAQFDEVIEKTNYMLQSNSLLLQIDMQGIENDTALFEVQLENLVGHKLPSGYPSRKVMVEFSAYTPSGDTLFHSGGFDQNGRINGELDDEYEAHYTDIYQEDQVQIYEYVMGNEQGDLTTILTRAYSPLKDNRIPPAGFTTGHISYDTVQIVGNAALDPDFNIENEEEGSAKDKLYYHIPVQGNASELIVNVKVHYISVPRKWLDQLFENDATEINDFETMYNEMDIESVIMKEEELLVTVSSVSEIDIYNVQVYPNPSNSEVNVISQNNQITSFTLFDSQGKEISISYNLSNENNTITLPRAAGKYYLKIHFSDGTIETKTIIKL